MIYSESLLLIVGIVIFHGCMQENKEQLYSLFIGKDAGTNVRLEEPNVDQYTKQFLQQCWNLDNLPWQDMNVLVDDHIGFGLR